MRHACSEQAGGNRVIRRRIINFAVVVSPLLSIKRLQAIGFVGLAICAVSIFQWIGVSTLTQTVDATGNVWGNDQHIFGLHNGIFFDFWCNAGNEWHSWKPKTFVTVRHPLQFGLVKAYHESRSTTLGFSWEDRPGMSMANHFYEATQWSFPVWPIQVKHAVPYGRS